MAKPPSIRVDIVKDSESHLVGVSFIKNRSPQYDLAVNKAQAADRYTEIQEKRDLIHAAVFGKTLESAERALDLIRLVIKWPGSQLFAKGRLITNTRDLIRVLECYLESFRCDDYRAHCHVVIKEPGFDDRIAKIFAMRIQLYDLGKRDAWVDSKIPNYIDLQRYIHPCKIAADSFNIDPDHPSEYKHQVQAHGVSICADICPRFNPADYKLSGKPVKVDVFDVD